MPAGAPIEMKSQPRARTAAVVLAIAALGVVLLLPGPPRQLPAIEWIVGPPGGETTARPYHELAPETPLAAAITTREPLHCYVVSWSTEDGTIAWFPSPLLRSGARNPVSAGTTRLPGTIDGKPLGFRARTGHAVTSWIAIASRTELRELEQLLPRLRQVSNMTFTDGSIVVSNPRRGEPVAGPGTAPPEGLLRQAALLAERPAPDGPMTPLEGHDGVWIAIWRTVATRGADGKPMLQDPLQPLRPMLQTPLAPDSLAPGNPTPAGR